MNIFARELVILLKMYGKELGNLYRLRSFNHQIAPDRVTRLKRSLADESTATLNAEELIILADWLRIDPAGNEVYRLRAALVAESVRLHFGRRITLEQANELGELTFRLLLVKDPQELLELRDKLLASVR